MSPTTRHPFESDPRELSDVELLPRLCFWRGEGKGAVSADALASGYEAEWRRREQDDGRGRLGSETHDARARGPASPKRWRTGRLSTQPADPSVASKLARPDQSHAASKADIWHWEPGDPVLE